MSALPADLRDAIAATPGRWLGVSSLVLGETPSTMDEAWRAIGEGAPHGFVVIADRQSAGRGSHGRRWESPGGQDLYLSAVARETAPRPTMTLAVALAVAEVVERFAPDARVRVKWPNDVLADEAKVAGILCESRSRGGHFDAVIGVGLNVNRERFAPAIEATSLRRLAGAPLDRGAVLQALLGAMERWLDERPEVVVRALDAHLAWRGERVCVDQLEGDLIGVAPTGGLRLRVDGVERVLHAGRLRRVGDQYQ